MRRQGFTLIELLIVIAIAAIIAGAMVPMFNVTRQDAKQAKASSELDTIKTAAIMLHHDTNVWPQTGAAGAGLIDDGSPDIADWKGPYIDAWGSDPWGMAYRITNLAAAPTLYVQSYGKDKTDDTGTDDDVKVILKSTP